MHQNGSVEFVLLVSEFWNPYFIVYIKRKRRNCSNLWSAALKNQIRMKVIKDYIRVTVTLECDTIGSTICATF